MFLRYLDSYRVNEIPIPPKLPPFIWSSFGEQESIIDTVINHWDVPDHHYVLCPVYAKVYDVQAGVSETVKIRERIRDAFQRMFGEELGLVYDSVSQPHFRFETYTSFKKIKKIGPVDVSVTALNLRHFRNVEYYDARNKINDPREEDESRKVAAIIHATKEIIIKYLNSTIILYPSDDKFIGIAAIKFSDLKEKFHKQHK